MEELDMKIALNQAIAKYETMYVQLDEFSKKRFIDGWFSWDNYSEYDIWNAGRKAREEYENGRKK